MKTELTTIALLAVISLSACSHEANTDTDNVTIENSVESSPLDMSDSNEDVVEQLSFGSEYQPFPEYSKAEIEEFFKKIAIASILETESTYEYGGSSTEIDIKPNIASIYLGQEAFEEQYSQIQSNPFKVQEFTDSIYTKAKSYADSVKGNRKFVINLDTYSEYLHNSQQYNDSTKNIMAFINDSTDDVAILSSYDIDNQIFHCQDACSSSILLKSMNDLSFDFSNTGTKSINNYFNRLYVPDQDKARHIQSLIDNNDLGIKGSIYIEFVDIDDVLTAQGYKGETIYYRLTGMQLDFYNRKTGEIVESAINNNDVTSDNIANS